MAADSMRLQAFEVPAGETRTIQVTDVLLSAPMLRFDEGIWVDATGDYDLTFSDDLTKMHFTNRRAFNATFGYRYYSTSWLGKRLGL